jgi:menaquinone-dependent protoporphyrinogen oxidase
MNVLLVYASTHGHTARIAARIARTLEDDGATVAVHPVGDAPDPHGFDAVVVGASIHAGHHQKELLAWAARHRTALAAVPSAFFNVCLTAADDTEESRKATRAYLDDFVEQTDWTPGRMTTFAGALQYREYDFPTRLLMRLLMKRGGHPTDASRDYDYTDWDAVDAFARQVVAASSSAAR